MSAPAATATDQTLTWTTFLTVVDDNLSVDADRLTEGNEKLAWAKSCLTEMQELLPVLRVGHQTIYQANDLAIDGLCSRFVLPPGSVTGIKIIRAEMKDDGLTITEARHATTVLPFEDLDKMRHGQLDVSHGNGYVCVDPERYTAWVYPSIDADMMVHVWWNGVKSDYAGGDQVPYTRMVAEAVAFFVRAEMRRGNEEEIGLFNSYLGSYRRKRLAIHRLQQEKV